MASNMEWDLTDAVVHRDSDQLDASDLVRTSNQISPQQSKQPLTREEKNRQLALYHANIIEQRKRIEKSILESTIKLIDYPLSPNADPGKPNAQDVHEVKQHLRLFQTYNFDELITERNIEKQCGYVLCPRPHKPIGRVGKFTILTKGRDLQVVNTDEVMRWCCDDCARRAMFLRVQLSETPAWERTNDLKLELADEEKSTSEDDNPNVDRDAVAKVAEDLKKLALERGNPNADKVMTDVVEKTLPHR